MTYTTLLKGAALAGLCAVTLVACEGGTPAPTSPSAVVGNGGAASNPDGTIVKSTTPVGLGPVHESTGVSLTPTLAAQAGVGRFQTPPFVHRFQISTSDTFDPITHTGMGSLDAQGIQRFVVPAALATGTKYYWRVRAEAEEQGGPWSEVRTFTTTGTVVAVPTPGDPNAKRTPNPAAGQTLPLPNMQGELAKFSNTSDSCPLGVQYVNSPWLDRVIDHFRTFDTRWGYNAKPTRSPSQNGGRPVVAAGDEAAYNFGSQADEGTTQVHLVDMLISHCGSSPSLGWRVFTGEEPGRWTGAGRF
jgi:hypothetical protein